MTRDQESVICMLACLVFPSLVACVMPEPTNPEDPGPAPIIREAGDCELACEKLEELDCPEAQSTPGKDRALGTADDGTCIDVCENTPVLRPDCVKEITSCDQIDACVSTEE